MVDFAEHRKALLCNDAASLQSNALRCSAKSTMITRLELQQVLQQLLS